MLRKITSQAWWPYVAPFAVFLLLLGASAWLPGGPRWHYPVRVLASAAVLVIWSRPLLNLRIASWIGSCLLGVLVFVIWVLPDSLWPVWRAHWLFANPLTAAPADPPGAELGNDWFFLFFRFVGSVLLVPVVEELFWRGWLMRYLISMNFQEIPLGAYAPASFWLTALLFASEHGPFWDVGLAAGVLYNWWLVRTRNLADCMLAHAVTNGCLAAYVLAGGHWRYWF